ncbi:hypothetical protein [Neobacillus mesonae]|uniref:hypothetical protein n=1 Tax=Neobacillus mesonae TaxID=1193713 RepID=UPI002041AAC7|nr:hypothetical protein [Neobacillus mesonae]MCM3569480.1 hypothetical protein [Neobacillus mesonae]
MNINANGQMVRLGKHGGLLLGINSDFLTLYSEAEGIIYYSMLHVKYFTEHVKPENHPAITLPEGVTYDPDFTLESLTEETPYPWVRISLGGPEKVEGILESLDDDFLTLIFHEEIIRVARYHIKTIGIGEKPKEEKAEGSEEHKEAKSDKGEEKKQEKGEGKKGDKKESGNDNTKKADKGKKNDKGEKTGEKDKKGKK